MEINFCSSSYFFNISQRYPFLVYDFRDNPGSGQFKNNLHCPFVYEIQSTSDFEAQIQYPVHKKSEMKKLFEKRKRIFNFFLIFGSSDIFSLFLSEQVRKKSVQNSKDVFTVPLEQVQQWVQYFSEKFKQKEIIHSKTQPHHYIDDALDHELRSTKRIIEYEAVEQKTFEESNIHYRRSSAPSAQDLVPETSMYSNQDLCEIVLQIYSQFIQEKIKSAYVLLEPMNVMLKSYPFLDYSLNRNRQFLDKTFPNEIIENKLYLGAAEHAKEVLMLEDQLKITHIVNATIEVNNYSNKITYLNIKIYDEPQEKICEYFDQVYQFMDEAISTGGKVLVHCAQGKSRSACFVTMYLMRKMKMSFDDAYEFIKERRDIVNMNEGFATQLSQCKFN